MRVCTERRRTTSAAAVATAGCYARLVADAAMDPPLGFEGLGRTQLLQALAGPGAALAASAAFPLDAALGAAVGLPPGASPEACWDAAFAAPHGATPVSKEGLLQACRALRGLVAQCCVVMASGEAVTGDAGDPAAAVRAAAVGLAEQLRALRAQEALAAVVGAVSPSEGVAAADGVAAQLHGAAGAAAALARLQQATAAAPSGQHQ